jgi:PKD repeat protein
MVEFALVLPLLFVLLLISIDFGRVYLGYINVQNMARIAANEAATNPDGWLNADPTVIASYRQQVLQDARAINCALPVSGGTLTAATDPTFNGNLVGDTATVRISCDFGVITPVISSIVGGTVTVAGEATFPIRTGVIANGGATGGGVDKPAADFFADRTSVPEGSAAQLRYSGGGGTPTSYFWEFRVNVVEGMMAGDLVGTSTAESPLFTFPKTGFYDVTVTATNSAGSDKVTKAAYITVLPSSTIAFSAAPLGGTAPLAVTFKDESADAVKWTWDFGDGTATSDEEDPTHVYTTVGSFDVTLTIEDSTGTTTSLTKTAFVSTDAGLCTVPNFFNVWDYDAQGVWSSAGFGTTVLFGDKPSFKIKSQTLVGSSVVPCNSTITVSKN